ncbi:BCAM0308 family protein [Geobacter sp.]|uniref:BCAM0308 family protein n=1 Tax=Geobacter sp. TaxID=46610 RepID=UPI0026307AB9|nr:BCAM0308 family protein [Geobacter sp.]
MTATKAAKRYGIEEHGKRTTRSTDVYLPKEGKEEVALCTKCGAAAWEKRWFFDEAEKAKLTAVHAVTEITCPSCQRMKDNNPAGVVTFSGDYLLQHENLILNAIKNVEAKTRTKNPLARIMEIKQDGSVLTVNTTDEKLAEKLGREIYKSHHGKLNFQWSEDESFVRVNWSR